MTLASNKPSSSYFHLWASNANFYLQALDVTAEADSTTPVVKKESVPTVLDRHSLLPW